MLFDSKLSCICFMQECYVRTWFDAVRADPDLPPFFCRDLTCKWITCGFCRRFTVPDFFFGVWWFDVFIVSFTVDTFSLQFAGLCDSGSLPCQTHEWHSQFGTQRTNPLQWIVQLCSDKHSLPLYLFPWLRCERRDKMHCVQSEHPYSYMYAECSWNKWRLANRYLEHFLGFSRFLWGLSVRSRELHCDNVSVCLRCSGSM